VSPVKDAYVTLQVSPDATDAELAAAYRSLARRFHPDLAGPAETEAMARINAAWAALRTPERRAAYDRARQLGSAARAAAEGGPPGSTSGDVRVAAWYWTHPSPDGTGAAGRPPGRASGSVLSFGRHIGWSLGEIARVDVGYLEWLLDRPEARMLRREITDLLVTLGRMEPSGDNGRRPAGASASPGRRAWGWRR
jgi:curved DNA-binding protein CbpA